MWKIKNMWQIIQINHLKFIFQIDNSIKTEYLNISWSMHLLHFEKNLETFFRKLPYQNYLTAVPTDDKPEHYYNIPVVALSTWRETRELYTSILCTEARLCRVEKLRTRLTIKQAATILGQSIFGGKITAQLCTPSSD